ncbi:hypothetical protein [Alteribacillus sp. YIM 98480]|uniref:hypothetical protein n=1 Tax=Alteribacillus sp. YIM 98480 TaxID=2606599 RepID=UPI001E3FD449|nr:hypothetical protein [Alteribacillus sp. YIM 98480]
MIKENLGKKPGTALVIGLFIFTGQVQAEQVDKEEYLIGFNTAIGEKEVQEVKQANGEIEHEFKHMNVLEIIIPKQAANAFENNPNVKFIEENEEMEALEQEVPWGLNRLKASDVHGDGNTGSM